MQVLSRPCPGRSRPGDAGRRLASRADDAGPLLRAVRNRARRIRYAVKRLPPEVLRRKLARRLLAVPRSVLQRLRGALCCSFGGAPSGSMVGAFAKLERLPRQPAWLGQVCRLYCAHRFDLLGAGWAHCGYGAAAVGMLGVKLTPAQTEATLTCNRANRRDASAIAALVDSAYQPIDWQRDIKSGFRWDERTWFRDIRYGHLPGVDIKLPWELARMQHLPHLAAAACYGRHGGFGGPSPADCVAEVRNQILDFIARNPPQRGVNWACTMDVAIRVSNWLVAYEILLDAGEELDSGFEWELHRSVRAHANHIAHHLEWSEEITDNHYLAGVVGLLFASTALPADRETDGWLAFSIAELIQAVEAQFNRDGSNFEASTSYHRLAAEMVLYATARVLGLSAARLDALSLCDPRTAACNVRSRNGPLALFDADQFRHPFPPAYCRRVARMLEFTRAIMKPDGLVPQIGDNDSGRFLKIGAAYRPLAAHRMRRHYANLREAPELPATYWYEDDLDHRSLLAAGDALLSGRVEGLDGWLIAGVARGRQLPVKERAEPVPADIGDRAVMLGSRPEGSVNTSHFSLPRGLAKARLRRRALPDFGLYVFSGERFYLAVRCGAIGKRGLGGHAHNDQLAIELQVDGLDVVRDPGTYTYTASIAERNRYRSAFSHFVPTIADREPSSLALDPFVLGGDPGAEVLYFGAAGFLGRHRGYGVDVWRKIRFEGDWLVVEDWCAALPLNAPRVSAVPYSPKYGWIENCLN